MFKLKLNRPVRIILAPLCAFCNALASLDLLSTALASLGVFVIALVAVSVFGSALAALGVTSMASLEAACNSTCHFVSLTRRVTAQNMHLTEEKNVSALFNIMVFKACRRRVVKTWNSLTLFQTCPGFHVSVVQVF